MLASGPTIVANQRSRKLVLVDVCFVSPKVRFRPKAVLPVAKRGYTKCTYFLYPLKFNGVDVFRRVELRWP